MQQGLNGPVPTAVALDSSCPGIARRKTRVNALTTRASIEKKRLLKKMDCRLKPGNDGG